mmetsp:Transcript_483/g.965  ORF Transcript_483/g.965 Transcript_483/m.965 type:complete len:509 (+) Transcript_483:91-1617(+)
MADPTAAPATTAAPKPGSDEDLAALAANFRGASGNPAPAEPAKNSDQDLAALAARLRGEQAEEGDPAPEIGHPAKNSDADLAALAASLGAAPQEGPNGAAGEGELHAIAQQLLKNDGSAQAAEPAEEKKGQLPFESKSKEGSERVKPALDGPVETPSGGKEVAVEAGEQTPAREGKDSDYQWVQFYDEESDLPYWYNTVTGDTTWEEPLEDYVQDESAAQHLELMTPKTEGVREGFICPKCMKDFRSQQELVAHCKTCTATSTAGPQSKPPRVPPPKGQSMSDRFFGLFGPAKDEGSDVKDILAEAGTGGGQVVSLTEKQLRKLIGLNKKNKALKLKLQKQTEKYNANIKTLVERDRKYMMRLRKMEEDHLKEIHVLKEQNARLARGIAQQHEEFKRKNFKVLKQNQSMGKQLSQVLIQLQEKNQLEQDNKNLRQEALKMRQYIQRLQRELLEQKNIVVALKDASKAAHRKILELQGKVQLQEQSVKLEDDMPVATLPGTKDSQTASV